MRAALGSKRMPYWVRLGIGFLIVSFVFVVISIVVKIGFAGNVDMGIPFPFHHMDSTPPVMRAGVAVVDPGQDRFLPVGVGLDLLSYLLVAAVVLRVIDSFGAKKNR